jgi:hypothetical protein
VIHTTTCHYNGPGDKLCYQRSVGNNRQCALDLNGDLSQILQDGIASYLYGLDLLGYDEWDESYTYQIARLRRQVLVTRRALCARSCGRTRPGQSLLILLGTAERNGESRTSGRIHN